MSEGPRYPEKVRREIDAGRLWRAREMLAGRIPQEPFSPELYEQYGRILFRLGEMMQAGKYLFLSGATDPEAREATGVYLGRMRRHGWRALMHSWPQRARRTPIRELPDPVQRELAEWGMPEDREPFVTAAEACGRDEQKSHWLSGLGCALAVVLCIAAFVVGLIQIAATVVSWLS